MYYLIILILLFFLMFSIIVIRNNGFFLSPSSVVLLSFIAVLSFSSMRYDFFLDYLTKGGIEEETFKLLLGCGLVFFCVDFIMSTLNIVVVSGKSNNRLMQCEFEELILNEKVLRYALVFSLICLAFGVLDFITNTNGSISERYVQHKRILYYATETMRFHGIASRFGKILMQITNVLLYYMGKTIALNGRKGFLLNDSKKILFISLVTMVNNILYLSSRAYAINVVLVFTISFVFWKWRIGDKIGIKIILYGVALGVFVIGSFSFVTNYAGINYTGKLFDYVGKYISGGLAGLDYRMGSNVNRSEYFGYHSLNALYRNLYSIGIVPENAVYKYGKDDFFVLNFTTTRTLFGWWYADFGLWGSLLVTGIVAFVICFIFYIVIRNKGCINPFWDVLYILLIKRLIYASFDDHISAILSLNILENVIYIIILSHMFLGVYNYDIEYVENEL